MKFEKRKMKHKIERIRLKRETKRSGGEGGEANQTGGARVAFGGARSLDFPPFIDKKKA